MSSQGHSKDPGKSKERNESGKEDKHGSPVKWRNPTSSSPGASPTHAGPSAKTHGNSVSFSVGKTAAKVKNMLQKFGKEDHVPQQPPVPVLEPLVPIKRITPPDQLGLEFINLDGAADIPIINGMPNGEFHNSNDGATSDNSGTTENCSDHESGSSTAGCQASGRNSNQSPSDLCAVETHISVLPENALEIIFSLLELADIRNASMVCQSWNRIIADENNEVWRTQCFKRMSRDVVYSELLSVCTTFKAKLRAHIHAWNPLDCSRNIYVKPNGFTIHRNPVAQSTDGARGRMGFNRGRHAWEVVWEGPLGTVAVVGVATQQAEVRAPGYIALLGKDDQSWGWNLVENLLLHNGDSQGNYPVINNAPRYQVGERIRVILDCEDNTLSFEKNFEFLGVAFRGLPNREKLYPAVSAVYGNTEISMVYLGPPLDG